MTKNKFITEAEFDGLCKLVFFQLTSSDSKELDREVLNYAIYWQICYLLEQPIDFGNNFDSRTITFQQNIQKLLNQWMSESFDVLQVIDRNIADKLSTGTNRLSVSNLENSIIDHQIKIY